jgi:diguanylate cyclase (GGDEF)-like protein
VMFADAAPRFPSPADTLWLAMYPLAIAAVALLVRSRHSRLSATVWLDGVIAGTVIAALVAAALLEPVFALTVSHGAGSVAQLGYPIGDLVAFGLVCVVWSLNGRRLSPSWTLLAVGFALLAACDSSYVVQAAHGDWTPGGPLDVPYVLATMALAGAAWAPSQLAGAARSERRSAPVVMPVASGVLALGLLTLAVAGELNPLATALALATMLAVVVRLAATLSSLTRQHVSLEAQAATDPLTGLANHRTFHERLAAALADARRTQLPLSVVALDLDHFKTVNDTFGHAEGDKALQAVAAELRRHTRGPDVVGRIGGEEFGLILPGADSQHAGEVAERCRRALSELAVDATALSCSAGVASFPADDPDGGRLLELADGALYWAKRAGRAQVRHYDPREVVLLSGTEQSDQVRAVLDGRIAISAVFQPIVELATGRIAGFEALTRFTGTDPVRAPDLWFAQARRCGLGPALEAHALGAALAVPGRPAGTFLSVNVSPGALVSTELARVLPQDLRDIVIELTEDDVFSSDPALDEALMGLRRRGARIAVDDAGAGYAGLQQIMRVKPDILKLDRSLMQGIHRSESQIALLDAMTRFATTTGAAVCGEGIETVEELRVLGRFDVTYGQGYALGRPGAAWPEVDERVAAEATAEVRWGMRLLAGASAGGDLTLGDISSALSCVRDRAGFDATLRDLERLVHADAVAISRVIPGQRCVETVSTNDGQPPGERFGFDEYPTTERVVSGQVLGQILAGDPAADPAEVAVLSRFGYSAVLMAPIILGGETIGLVEIYRCAPRPWTGTEADHVRLLAQQFGALLSGTVLDAGEPVRG